MPILATLKLLTHAHTVRCLTAAQQSFLEHEALVHTQLSQLIKDGMWLKTYIAAVMRVQQSVSAPAAVSRSDQAVIAIQAVTSVSCFECSNTSQMEQSNRSIRAWSSGMGRSTLCTKHS